MATRISTALYRPSLDPLSGDKSSICDHEWTRLPARQRHAMTRQPPPSFRSDSVSERALRAFRCGTLEYVRWCRADQVAGRMESNPPRHYHTKRHPRTAQLKVFPTPDDVSLNGYYPIRRRPGQEENQRKDEGSLSRARARARAGYYSIGLDWLRSPCRAAVAVALRVLPRAMHVGASWSSAEGSGDVPSRLGTPRRAHRRAAKLKADDVQLKRWGRTESVWPWGRSRVWLDQRRPLPWARSPVSARCT